MIQFEEFVLSNGLEVIIHSDHSVSTVCVNTLYKVGSRNEDPNKTGFAHLFEHLMFGGSKHIDSFDEPLQSVGGENNAFTNTDITNYYITVPSINVETALWLESDRMLSLSFKPEVLEIQRSVVIEEYKQRYLNQPYGDVWHKLRPEAYKVHPYMWPTIGKDISHIENATMDDVKAFFYKYYNPSNAIIVLAGDITVKKGLNLVEKWFGEIPAQPKNYQEIPQEPRQDQPRVVKAESNVPQDAWYKVFHMPGRTDKKYYAVDLLGDLMGRGRSSSLYEKLVKRKALFSSISTYVTGSIDPGLLVVTGKLNPGVSFDSVEEELDKIIDKLKNQPVEKKALDKVKNMAQSSIKFGEVEVLNRAMSLAYAKYLGNAHLVNDEAEIISNITDEEIMESAGQILNPQNSTTLYYQSAS
jgi:zinc protease